MKTRMLTFLFLIVSSLSCKSQDFKVSEPILKFDGNELRISYNLEDKTLSDEFYIWVEMSRKNGEKIIAKTFSGDIGENIGPGSGKIIIWVPAKDSVFLNEEILVEVMAEKYVKEFNKKSMVLNSALLPGLGQSKIRRKPYWIAGVISYSAIASGILLRTVGNRDYDIYLHDENFTSRNARLAKAQRELNGSSILFISGATIWAANLIWAATIPDNYKPLKNVRLSLKNPPLNNTILFGIQINF